MRALSETKALLVFVTLRKLPVKILNGVGGVDKRVNLRGALEHGGKLRPVHPPALDAQGIFRAHLASRSSSAARVDSSVAAL